MTGFTAADVPDQTGKTIVVTGANTGLGFEVAKTLAGKGARVLLGCRSKSKAQAANDKILAAFPKVCLLYTSDAADEEDRVDVFERRVVTRKM